MDAQWIEFLKSALRESPALVVLVGVLFVYRRDVHRALNSWQGQTKILTDLVEKNIGVMQHNTDAIQSLADELRRR